MWCMSGSEMGNRVTPISGYKYKEVFQLHVFNVQNTKITVFNFTK